MANRLTSIKIDRVSSHRINYQYAVEGEWSRFFNPQEPMWVEYSVPVDTIPDSVAVVPLLGNFLVLAALMDAEFEVDEIDADFYACTEEVIDGFAKIMPDHVHFRRDGLIKAGNVVRTPLGEETRGGLLFFSGGVDATSSLVSHLAENPALVSIWGADIGWDNADGWNCALSLNQEVADKYGLELLTIHSNFRKSYNDVLINNYCRELVEDWWWSAFHHSVTMMCLAAPLAGGNRAKLYFGSTYSSKDKKEWGTYVTASDPLVDDHVRFCGCQVVHDGYEFSRYDKIERISRYYQGQKDKPFLRVCYLSNTGRNCGRCEKCASAIKALQIAGADPKDYGFTWKEEEIDGDFAAAVQEMARAEKYAFLSFYYDVHKAYRQKYRREEAPAVLKAFYDLELEELADFLHVQCNEVIEMAHNMDVERTQLLKRIQEAGSAQPGMVRRILRWIKRRVVRRDA